MGRSRSFFAIGALSARRLGFVALAFSVLFAWHLPVQAYSTDGLVAHYKFENDLSEESGQHLDATAPKGIDFVESPLGGFAARLDGVDDYIALGDLGSFQTTTINIWVLSRIPKYTTYQYHALVYRGLIDGGIHDPITNNTFDIFFGLSGIDQQHMRVRSGNFELDTTTCSTANSCAPVLPTLHMLTYVLEQTNGEARVSFYQDGVLVRTLEYVANIDTTYDQWFISKGWTSPSGNRVNPIDGDIDEVLIYSRALTEEEVCELAGDRCGLVAHYTFEEADVDVDSHLVLDTSDHNPSAPNDGLDRGLLEYVPGRIGRAAKFDGTDYIEVPSSASLRVEYFSLAFWIRTEQTNNLVSPISAFKNATGSSGSGLEVTMIDSPKPGILMSNFFVQPYNNVGTRTTASILSNAQDLPLSQWHHIVMTWDGLVARAYRDSQLDSEFDPGPVYGASWHGPIRWDSREYQSFFIGKGHQPNRIAFVGELDDVRIYNRALTEKEVAQLFNADGSNTIPVADAGDSFSYTEGTLVILDGSGSRGENLTYQWTQTHGPLVDLDLSFPASPQFIAPEVRRDGATLRFLLVVSNQYGVSAPSAVEIFITNINKPPLIDGPSSAVVEEGEEVTLTFVATDPDPDGYAVWCSKYDDLLPAGSSLSHSTWPFLNRYSFSWKPGYSQAKDDAYEFTVCAVDNDDGYTEHTVTITVTDVSSGDKVADAIDIVSVIPSIHFDGDKVHQQEQSRRFFDRKLMEIESRILEGSSDSALGLLVNLLGKTDNGWFDGDSQNDKIKPGTYQRELLENLVGLGKLITQNVGDIANNWPPMIIVHGWMDEGKDYRWSEFIRQTNLRDAGEDIEVSSIVDVQSDFPVVDTICSDPSCLNNNALLWRVTFTDSKKCKKSDSSDNCSVGAWGDSSLEKQADFLALAVDEIFRRSGKDRYVFLGHSMGGLTIKSYLLEYDGYNRAAGYFTVGTPHLSSPATIVCELSVVDDYVPILAPHFMGDYWKYNDYCVWMEKAAAVDMRPNSAALEALIGTTGSIDHQMAFGTWSNEGTIAWELLRSVAPWMGCEELGDFPISDGIVPTVSQLSVSCTNHQIYLDMSFWFVTEKDIPHRHQLDEKDVIDRILYQYWKVVTSSP